MGRTLSVWGDRGGRKPYIFTVYPWCTLWILYKVYILCIYKDSWASNLHQHGVAEVHCTETHVACGQSLPLQSGNVCEQLCPPWKPYIETLTPVWWYLEGEPLRGDYLMGMEPSCMELVLLWRRPQNSLAFFLPYEITRSLHPTIWKRVSSEPYPAGTPIFDFGLQKCEKETSIVYKPLSLWSLLQQFNRLRHQLSTLMIMISLWRVMWDNDACVFSNLKIRLEKGGYMSFYLWTCIMCSVTHIKELSWWLSGKESACQCKGYRFDPWVGKTPWRREWQPTPIFLPGKLHGQRGLAG